MRTPKLMKLLLIIPAYPILYFTWVNQIKNTWIQNDIKDLHPQILFPEHQRYTSKHFEDCLKFQRRGLRQEYTKRIKLCSGSRTGEH